MDIPKYLVQSQRRRMQMLDVGNTLDAGNPVPKLTDIIEGAKRPLGEVEGGAEDEQMEYQAWMEDQGVTGGK